MFHLHCYLVATVIHIHSVHRKICVYTYTHILHNLERLVGQNKFLKTGITVNAACHIGHVCHRFVSPALVGQGLIIIEASQSHTDTPHAVGLLWMNEEPNAETSTCQPTTLTRGKHPCLRQDLNSHTSKRVAAESCLRL